MIKLWFIRWLILVNCFIQPNSVFSQASLKLYFSDPGKKSQGYYFLTLSKPVSLTIEPFYNVLLDEKGELIYYQRLAGSNNKVCDFKLLPNGLLSYFNKDRFYLLDSTFNIIDSVLCKNGVQTDNHELLLLPNGNYAMLGTEKVSMDLSEHKIFNRRGSAGSKTAVIICGVIQEQDKMKNVVFEWHAKDHFQFPEVDTFYLSDPNKVDWHHINALALTNDGNYLLSVRHFNEVTKISRQKGTIMWRLGGSKNNFRFMNDSGQFIGQHNIMQLVNGNLTLYDNGRKLKPLHPGTAKEYKVDEINKKVTLIWHYTDRPEGTSYKGLGNVQRLSDGNSLVNYGISHGTTKIFSILTPLNMIVAELRSEDSLRSYRVYNYKELPFRLDRPVIKKVSRNNKVILEADKKYPSYRWSNGSTGSTIEISTPGKYTLWVPAGKGGFISSKTLEVKIDSPQK